MKTIILLLMPVLCMGQVNPMYNGLFSGGDFTAIIKGGETTIKWTECPKFNPNYEKETNAENYTFDITYMVTNGYGLGTKMFKGTGDCIHVEDITLPYNSGLIIVTVLIEPKGKYFGAGSGSPYYFQRKFMVINSQPSGLKGILD